MSDTKHPSDKTLSQLTEKYSKVVPIIKHPLEDKINLIGYEDMISKDPKAVEYVLHPWLPMQGIAFIYAATGVGKTLFAMNTAYAIAGGGNFLKYKAIKPRKILYVDGEMAYNQIHARFIEMVRQQGPLFDPKMWNLLTPDLSPFALPKICTPDGQQFYNNLIEKEKIEVLFIDNLSVLSTIDTNKPHEWKPIQDWLIYLRTKGIVTVIVHHAGKNKEDYRGTSNLMDCVDTQISLQSITDENGDEDLTKGKRFKIVYHKNRSFYGEEALPYEAYMDQSLWGFRTMEINIMDKIIAGYKAGMTQRDMAQENGLNQTKVFRLLRKAMAQGLLPSK